MSATVEDVREVLARRGELERRRAAGGRRRLPRPSPASTGEGERDALLQGVEVEVTLIGATTGARTTRSTRAGSVRAQVSELEALTPEEIAIVVRGLGEVGGERRRGALELIAHRSGGDARAASTSSSSAQRRRRRPRRGEREDAAAAAAEQGGRRALQYATLGVHRVDRRRRPGRRRVLPGRSDARSRRGCTLHRAADDRARLRGHRQRRPARAPRRRRSTCARPS